MGEEAEKHVCCDCKKAKKRHKLVDFFRFKRKGEVVKDEEGDLKENVEAEVRVSGESTDAAANNIVKTEEKTSGFFWNMKRETDMSEKKIKREADVSEKTTKQTTTEEELRDDTKTNDLAAEVMIFIWKI